MIKKIHLEAKSDPEYDDDLFGERVKNSELVKMTKVFRQVAEDLNLKDNDFFIAGGSAREIYQGQPISKDVDVYFRSPQTLFKCIQNLKIDIDYETANSWTITGSNGYKIDIIKNVKESIVSCLEAFDFTCCQYAFDSKYCYKSNETSDTELIVNEKLADPLGTFYRVPRYIKKGFTISRHEMYKIAKAVRAMEESTFVSQLEAIEKSSTENGSR